MLKIKLSRQGKKKYPVYRLIVSEVGRDPYGDVLEIVGSYNPHTKEFSGKADRIKHWLDCGAQMTPTINNLLIEKKVIEGKKTKVSKLTKKARAAIAKKEADAAAKAAADKAAAEAPVETPVETAPIEEAPVEETKE